MSHGTTVAVMLGNEEPPLAIIFDPEGIAFFSVVMADAPPPDDQAPVPPLVCGHCLIETYPELGEGLDLALEVGGSMERDRDGGWRLATDPAYICEPAPGRGAGPSSA